VASPMCQTVRSVRWTPNTGANVRHVRAGTGDAFRRGHLAQRSRVRFPLLPGVAVGLKRGPLNLMRINEDLLERKSSGSGLEN
jgi:hypothetical protein